MSPDLLNAVKERISLGYSEEEIVTELSAAGYDAETIEAVFAQAKTEHHPEAETAVPAATGGVEVPHPPAGGSSESGVLIGYSELISRSWQLFTSRIGLFAKAFLVNMALFLVAGAVFLLTLLGGLGSTGGFEGFLVDEASMPDLSGQSLALIGIVTVLLLIAVIVVSMSVFGATIRNLLAEEPEGFIESWKWMFRENRVVSLILIALFTYLANQTGYLLLVIPGIAMAVYFMFSSYVLVGENVRGLAAMVRSTEIVYGRWWGVVGRLLVVVVVVALAIFGAVIASALMLGGLSMMGGGFAFGLLIALFYVGLMFVTGAFMTSVLTTLYRSLTVSAADPTFSEERKGKLKTWFLVAVIIGPIATIVLQGFGTALEDDDVGDPGLDTMQAALVSQQLSNAVVQAELYYNDGGFSYFGVCSDLERLVSNADSVQCNDAIESWAMTATLSNDTWCADSTGFNKRVQTALEDRTQCLDLPNPSAASEAP